MEDEWWLHKAKEIKKHADENNSAGFFNALKVVHGPQAIMSNTLLAKDKTTTISEPNNLMERWCEYFVELLNVESITDDTILNQLPDYQQMSELDRVPIREEMTSAISKIKNGKAPGNDGIPAEIFKHGGEHLNDRLHQLIVMSWQQAKIPQGLRDVRIIPIFEKKGDHRDCGNYRGISLLGIAGKIMVKIVQTRLEILAEGILTESQCGFRRERSTTDMIFSLRQIQEKVMEQ